MQILFDDSKRIIGVYSDDNAVTPAGVYVIKTPEIVAKLSKTSNTARQQHDGAGRPLYSSGGKVTASPTTRFKPNETVTEQVAYSRPVSLKESPAEWSVEDVLHEKYKLLADGKHFWFDQFLNTHAVADSSTVNKGVFGLSIPPKGELKFKPVKLVKPTLVLKLYLEADNSNFDIYVKTENTLEEVKAKDGVVSFASSQMVNIRIVNKNQSGAATPLKAFAFFYV